MSKPRGSCRGGLGKVRCRYRSRNSGQTTTDPCPSRRSWLLRNARTLLDTNSPSLVIALMAFLTVNPAPLRRASRETFNALARCLAARDAPHWLTAATALSGEIFFIFVWAISMTSCFVNRRIRRPSYAAVCLLGAGE